jgi:hypothetical protein
VHRELSSDLEDLKRGVRPEDVVDDDHIPPVHHSNSDRGVSPLGETLGMNQRPGSELVEVEIGVPELEQASAELVLIGVPILLDEPMSLQGLKEAVHGRTGESEPIGDLADPQTPRPAGQNLQNPRGSIHRLNRRPAAGLRSCSIRHCRIVFGTVDWRLEAHKRGRI